MNQNVEVTELPKREVTIDRSGQSRTFVGDSRYTMCLEFIQDSEQFSGKEKVAQAIGTKVLSKASQSIFRDTIRMCSVEVPVQEWRYSMPVCRSEQVLPINAFLEQGLDSGGCVWRPNGPGTAEKKLDFGTASLHRRQHQLYYVLCAKSFSINRAISGS